MGIKLTICLLFCCRLFSQNNNVLPSDTAASSQTINLYKNLRSLAQKGFMFGHQDDLAYGVNWKYQSGKSDVKDVCGDYPAVYGWDISGIETGDPANIDGVPFSNIREYIKEGYRRGGVVTISWHMKSPLGNPKGAWDTDATTVPAVLPGGARHELFKGWLDSAAVFIQSLKGNGGEQIPILFRPFHELTGGWFWWGKEECRPDQFVSLWRFTINYLRNEKKLHNMLLVYNCSGELSSEKDLLERYPGDDMADVLSFDTYQGGGGSSQFVNGVSATLDLVERVSKQRNKLFSLAETGYEAIPEKNWWTETLIKAIGEHKISYVLVWRNHGYHDTMKRMHYYAPYPGQVSAVDFVKFYSLQHTLFEKDIAKEVLYENKN